MRLVHLLSGLEIGGKERVALKLARRGRGAGLDHRVLVFDTPFRSLEVDLDPGDVPVEFIRRGPGLDRRFTAEVARHLATEGVEVVHAHNDTALVYAVLAARRLGRGRRPRVVGTFHTRPSHPTFGARLMNRWAARQAHVVTAVSPDLTAFLIERGWLKRCVTLWNGIDLSEYRPAGSVLGLRERLGIAPGAILVGHVGRFDPVKRQQDLLSAARDLADGKIAFVFVGQGPQRDDFLRAAESLPHVFHVPSVQDVPAFMRELDIFVLCSGEEAAPMVLLEAMACGRAIVATRVGGVPNLLGDGNGRACGRLVPPAEPAQLASAVQDLARSESARNQLGKSAREHAAKFSEDREWGEYMRLYGADE